MTWFSVQVALRGIIARGQPHHMHLTSLERAWSRAALGPAALTPSRCLLEVQALGLPRDPQNQNLYFDRLPGGWGARQSARSPARGTQVSPTFLLMVRPPQSLVCSIFLIPALCLHAFLWPSSTFTFIPQTVAYVHGKAGQEQV